MLAACDNQNSVNILISNSSDQPLENREVTIALDTIRQWLDISISDTLILLNEKNQPLPYTPASAIYLQQRPVFYLIPCSEHPATVTEEFLH